MKKESNKYAGARGLLENDAAVYWNLSGRHLLENSTVGDARMYTCFIYARLMYYGAE